MWAGVLKDLDQVETRDVESAYRDIYWRVKSAGKFALSYKPVKRLKFSAGSSEQIFRSFGDDARNEFEFSASRTGLNKYFA